MQIKLMTGDSLHKLKDLKDNSVHSIVSDPPYGLGKEPDPVKVMTDWCTNGFHEVKSKGGFMGKEWDSFVPQPILFKEALRVLKPGGYALIACGTRTEDWMAMSLRFAGFEIRDVICWHYGCLSDDTEIYTQNGWIPYKYFSEKRNVSILCYSKENDSYHYEVPQRWNEYTIKDTCYRIQSYFTDQIVSRNHRCLVEREGALVFEYAETLASEHKICIPFLESLPVLSKNIFCENKRAGEQEQILRKSLQQRNDRQSKQWGESACTPKKFNGGDNLLCLLKKEIQIQKGYFKLAATNMFNKMQRGFKGTELEKACTQRQSELDTAIRNNPSKTDDRENKSSMEGRRYLQKQEGVLCGGQAQVPEMSSGVSNDGQERRVHNRLPFNYGSAVRPMSDEDRSSSPYRSQPGKLPYYKPDVVCEQQRPQEIRSRATYNTCLATVEPVDYNGVIFCPTVSTGAFVARRKGKIFITGNSGFPKSLDISKNIKATDEAKKWEGWGTALKPATEFWILARKPLAEGTVAQNVLAHGTGGINIDGCRVKREEGDRTEYGRENLLDYEKEAVALGKYNQNTPYSPDENGRWPANVVLDEFMADVLDGQSGVLKSGARNGVKKERQSFGNDGTFKEKERDTGNQFESSEGGASRFFYCAKTSKADRNEGLEGFKEKVTTDGRNKSIDNAYNRGETQRLNNHPTVKPTALMRWLVKLITPPGGVCLDPFNGSGSTGKACALEGFNYIGIEREPEYIEISAARIAAIFPDVTIDGWDYETYKILS